MPEPLRPDTEPDPFAPAALGPVTLRNRVIKAATYSSHKWAWVESAAPELSLIRTSVGRHREVAYLQRDDTELVALAVRHALDIGAGHSFVVFLREGFPVNVLNQVKSVPEVCRVYCATANPVQVLVAETEQGRGVLGVVDGETPLGVENDDDERDRRTLLREIGYKL